MSYDLLDKAPKDHMSEEFLQFLRENNKVIYEDIFWLVIANCKYDKQASGGTRHFLRQMIILLEVQGLLC